MNVVDIDPTEDAVWATLIAQHDSDVFHSPAWLKVLADTYGFEPRAVAVLDESGTPTSGVAYCHVNGMKGERLASLPFSDFCDPLVTEEDDWHRIADRLIAGGHPVALRLVHNELALGDPRFHPTGDARWHGIDLKRDLDAIWQDLSSSARRAIRKARSSDVEVRPATAESDLRAFFELHLRVRKYRYRMLAQPYAFFTNIFHRFLQGENGVLLLAEVDEQIIGGVLFLTWKDKLYYKFNASDAEYSGLRPNDAVMWAGIEYGKESGMNLLDLGLSDSDQAGLIRYKEKYATEERDIKAVSSADPNDSGDRESWSFLPRLVDLLTADDVPDGTTERAGDLLYRMFA